MLVLANRVFGPSAFSANICRCGMIRSRSRRNRMPIQKPAAAGKKAREPIPSDCCIAGINRLQMDAAVITPLAKPVNARCTFCRRSFFIKKKQADPAAVPQKGISKPNTVSADILKSTHSCQCHPSIKHQLIGMLFMDLSIRVQNPVFIIRIQIIFSSLYFFA